MTELNEEQRDQREKPYVAIFAVAAALIALIPLLLANGDPPAGASYVGFHYNTDDHMVYSAWMRQAMEGRFFFDNRFAVDAQPGLTVHVYFFLLGLIAKLTGIPLAATLAKAFFSGLFVVLLHRLAKRVAPNVYTTKLSIAFVVLGGGLGFLVWHNYGVAIVKQGGFNALLAKFTAGGLPVDVWQPEGFVFPSMLTNSLFMVSLCLILTVFLSFLSARDSWKHVPLGAVAMAVLMNIHSYDVLLIAFVMVAFLVMQIVRKQISTMWIIRALVIAAGAIPPALWFLHVLQNDPVFQARAATPTYAANFRMVLFGYILLMGLGLVAAVRTNVFDIAADKRRYLGVGMFLLIVLGLYLKATPGPEGYFLAMGPFIGVMALAVVALALLATDEPAWNLVLAWAVVGLLVPYFPALFQRKLMMGLSVPWAIMAAVGVAALMHNRDRQKRNLVTVLTIIALSGTSMMWLVREKILIDDNVSNTTVHAVYLTRDQQDILRYLNANRAARDVLVALPGVSSKPPDSIDQFESPLIPDLNSIASGYTGVYTYSGHWSETPDYGTRRNEATALFVAQTSPEQRQMLLEKIKPDYLIAPNPETYGEVFADLTGLGEVVAGGDQFQLIKVN